MATRAQTQTALTARIVGSGVTRHEEANGYLFWGLMTLFIGLPEVLAATSKLLKADIPWPTISNLVGKDLESHHHWIALIVVVVIVFVVSHLVTYPPENKKLGRALGKQASSVEVGRWEWGLAYIALTTAAGAAAGGIAAWADANKNQLGYVIYLTLAFLAIVAPAIIGRPWHKLLAIPTLFATIALLRTHKHWHWFAVFVIAWLVTLTFHLALYPWPNYHFGTP